MDILICIFNVELFPLQGDAFDSIAQAKTTANEATAAAQQAMYSQPCTLSQIHEREVDTVLLLNCHVLLIRRHVQKDLALCLWNFL